MTEHVARVRNLWRAANDMGAKILDTQFRTIFISLLGEEWDTVVPVLHTFKTSAEVISFVNMHAERLNRTGVPSTSTPAPQVLAANTNFESRDARRAARRNLICTNSQCGADGKKGHTIENCFWPGGGKAGQWPSWWKGKKGPATPAVNAVETFAFSEIVKGRRFLVYSTSETEHVICDNHTGEDVSIRTDFLNDPAFDLPAWYTHQRLSAGGVPEAVLAFMADAPQPRPYVVVADSGSTDHCFWKREDFVEYYPAERAGTAAEGSPFRILATGVVRKTVMYEGQKKEIALNAIHTPDITTNLISISKLDASGYSVEFGKGKAVF
ncbi:hypothetical protein C8R46DRAFT_925191, partial [Mycena filopes]